MDGGVYTDIMTGARRRHATIALSHGGKANRHLIRQ
jgi:hypothetical protein